MVYQLTSYFKFLLHSTNEHGVHSPFVYELVTQCFYDTKKHKEYATLKAYREALAQDNSTVTITDFGAGSRVFKSNQRSVQAIAKNAGITKKRQQLLFRLAQFLKPASVVELGTSVGLGTVALALGVPSKNITTVEGCTATANKAKEYLTHFGIDNVTVVTSTFETFFQQTTTETFDFVYVDGNHSKEATLHHFTMLLKNVHNNSVLLFDDIYWSPEMTEAWKEICKHPKVTVSIDTFQWGLVFFRSEQPKQHFTIRV